MMLTQHVYVLFNNNRYIIHNEIWIWIINLFTYLRFLGTIAGLFCWGWGGARFWRMRKWFDEKGDIFSITVKAPLRHGGFYPELQGVWVYLILKPVGFLAMLGCLAASSSAFVVITSTSRGRFSPKNNLYLYQLLPIKIERLLQWWRLVINNALISKKHFSSKQVHKKSVNIKNYDDAIVNIWKQFILQ